MSLGENKALTLYASQARTATPTDFNPQNNRFARGVDVIIDMTVVPGVDTVTFTIEGYDQASQKWYTILASAALVAIATTVLRVFPGATASANAAANAALPVGWRVRATHSAGTSFTYSVGANLLM